MEYFCGLFSCFPCCKPQQKATTDENQQTSDESLIRSLRMEVRSLKEENAKKDKIIKQLNELKRSETTKHKIKEKERHESYIAHQKINIVEPPKQITDLHSLFVQELKSEFEKAGSSLTQSSEGPALVSVINSSRPVADIRRDLGRCKEDLQEIMLVIFKLSTHANEKPSVKISEIGDPRVKRACFIMVDSWKDSYIVDCQVNDDSFQDILKFIENQTN